MGITEEEFENSQESTVSSKGKVGYRIMCALGAEERSTDQSACASLIQIQEQTYAADTSLGARGWLPSQRVQEAEFSSQRGHRAAVAVRTDCCRQWSPQEAEPATVNSQGFLGVGRR